MSELNNLIAAAADHRFPAPWRLDGPAVCDCGDAGKASINGETVDVWYFNADASEDQLTAKAQAKAELIVHCVNNLPKMVDRAGFLVAACQNVLNCWDSGDLAGAVRNMDDELESFRRALAAAKTPEGVAFVKESPVVGSCALCGHSAEDHDDNGHCHNGEGCGNRCSCRTYIREKAPL